MTSCRTQRAGVAALVLLTLGGACSEAPRGPAPAELGPRPGYLVDRMEESPLKEKLRKCLGGRAVANDFSIAHRGAPLMFPEHTQESYVAAARMGAGILECDVTFTADAELVCRHAQCDLHATTNILATPLASRCSEPFTPAELDPVTGELLKPASARCCAGDLTLEEFKSPLLCGRMDAANPRAATVEEYLRGGPAFRTDLYSTCGTLLSHAESIELIASLGRKHIPELKSGDRDAIAAVFGGQEAYARRLVEAYEAAGVSPADVWLQSFDLRDVLSWIETAPAFGRQAVLLDAGAEPRPDPVAFFESLSERGVRFVGPAIPLLLAVDASGDLVPSEYALAARRAGLGIVAWTIERSGRIAEDVLADEREFYYATTRATLGGDGDILRIIDVLARDVGAAGLFSDWPATTTFYANCLAIP